MIRRKAFVATAKVIGQRLPLRRDDIRADTYTIEIIAETLIMRHVTSRTSSRMKIESTTYFMSLLQLNYMLSMHIFI